MIITTGRLWMYNGKIHYAKQTSHKEKPMTTTTNTTGRTKTTTTRTTNRQWLAPRANTSSSHQAVRVTTKTWKALWKMRTPTETIGEVVARLVTTTKTTK